MSNPEHESRGDPCSKCGLPQSRHRKRNRGKERAAYMRAWHEAKKKGEIHIIAIDGEGYTDDNGNHRYTYMAAASANELVSEVENPRGLRTVEVFEFLLDLPKEALKTGFSLGYDITKWIEDMPNGAIYQLNHPESRPGPKGPLAVHWRQYFINRVSSRFSVREGYPKGSHKGDRSPQPRNAVIWDLFKFFGKAFVKALEDWKVGNTEELAAIQDMKDKRGVFKGISEAEKAYCRSECRFMAEMADKLLTAHVDADLKLKNYYGPGSTASIMLDRMGAKEQIAIVPAEMQHAVDCAYAGGRFEHSCVGPFYDKKKNAYGADIASAYPYAMTQMPCLLHGKWELITNKKVLQRKIERAPAACVHYRLLSYDNLRFQPIEMHPEDTFQQVAAVGQPCYEPWGPFPYRCTDGNILFPVVSPGGWVWQDEFLAGQKHFPNVEATEAWILNQRCSCGNPFFYKIAQYYNLRLEWGKEGKGIVVKLGMNSCYGKRAQRAGKGPYRCLVSAGIITSFTRAMLIEAIFRASDPWNVGSLATDGVMAREELDLPKPLATGTHDQAKKYGKSPLGKWETKPVLGGVHLIRPGLRFPLSLTDDDKTIMANVAARGLGTRVLFKNRQIMMEEWDENPMRDVRIQQPDLFMGAKSSIVQHKDGDYERHDKYGKWETPEPRKVSYASIPKRPTCLGPDEGFRLTTWALSSGMAESAPYTRTQQSALARHAADMKTLEWEQPDQGKLYSY